MNQQVKNLINQAVIKIIENSSSTKKISLDIYLKNIVFLQNIRSEFLEKNIHLL